MDNSRKRVNKKQQHLMVESLHANMEVARGNSANADFSELWSRLATQLNCLGCRRTAEEWQKVWSGWVVKVKTKARKVRDSINATGGGPPNDPLTPTEEKVIEILGSAAIYGVTNREYPRLDPPSPISPPDVAQDVPPPLSPPTHNAGPTRRRRHYRRLNAAEPLGRVLQSNSTLHRESLLKAAECLASAIRESAAMMCEVVRESTEKIIAALPEPQPVVVCVAAGPQQQTDGGEAGLHHSL